MEASKEEKKKLRQHFRHLRRNLSPDQQVETSQKVCDLLSQSLFFQKTTFACYLAMDGEVNMMPFIESLWYHGKRCYLPVVRGNKQLRFSRFCGSSPLKKNKYQIPEPIVERNIKISMLDFILMPLVAFDRQGRRLGMGGGFYDRTLMAVKQADQCLPTLVGVAHACQEAQGLPSDSWDIPLDYIVTDQELIKVR